MTEPMPAPEPLSVDDYQGRCETEVAYGYPCDLVAALRTERDELKAALAGHHGDQSERCFQCYIAEPVEDDAPCACSPGDECLCDYDCECREKFVHQWFEDAGRMNVGLTERAAQ